MTRATLDWLAELTTRHGAGVEAIALFHGIDEPTVIEAIRDCEIRTLPAGAILLHSGKANHTIYILLSGQLAAYLDADHLTGMGIPIRPGDSAGEMSAIDGKPASAFVIALTEVRVLVLPSDVFWSRLAPIPAVMRNVVAVLSERMRRGNDGMLAAQRNELELAHVRKELQIARALQASMIPARGRLFPGRADVEVAGMMTPASEVGGDFFDAFFVDAQHLFFCVGDVSGHGIPAALFMARAIGVIRVAAMSAREPGQLLARVNDELCSGNDTNMFVTLFCAFLDVRSGRLVYANAGHCAPLVARPDHASLLPIPKDVILGVLAGRTYAAMEMQLDEVTVLVGYTDGLLEAESRTGEAFSQYRLLSVAAANSALSVERLLQALQREVFDFLGGRPAADDCTMLACRRAS